MIEPVRQETVQAFILRHLKVKPKDVYLIPWGPRFRVVTFTAPGAQYLGSYTRDVPVEDLHEDALFAARAAA